MRAELAVVGKFTNARWEFTYAWNCLHCHQTERHRAAESYPGKWSRSTEKYATPALINRLSLRGSCVSRALLSPSSSRDLLEQQCPAFPAQLSGRAAAAVLFPELSCPAVTQVPLLILTQGRCTPSNSEGLRRALLPPRTETTKSQLRREALSLFRCEALSQWNFLHSRPGIYLGGNVNDSRAEPIQFIYRHVLRWLWSVTDLETHCSTRTLARSYFYATIKFPVLWPHPGFVPWPYTCSEQQPPSWGKNLKPPSLLPKPVSSLRKGSKSG